MAQKKHDRLTEQQQQYNERARELEQAMKGYTHPDNHNYAISKGIETPLEQDIKLTERGHLAIPIYNKEGKMQSVQYIAEDGSKRYASGGEKAGGMYVISDNNENGKTLIIPPEGQPKNNDLLICEGYSTGKSIHEATKLPVAVAFDAGNLHIVAQHFKQAYPDTNIHICADNDREKEINTGREAAERVSEAMDVNVILPRFTKGQRGSDFNDLKKEAGLEAVRTQIRTAISLYKGRQESLSVKNEAGISTANLDKKREAETKEKAKPRILQKNKGRDTEMTR